MRVLDGEKILNIPRNRINNVAKSVFMDYYLAIQEIFIKSKIAFKVISYYIKKNKKAKSN